MKPFEAKTVRRIPKLALGFTPLLFHLLATAPALAADAPPSLLQPAIIAPLATHSLLMDGTTAGERLVAVGERGHILLSDDQGLSWRQVPVPVRTTLTAVFFINERRGWAVGHDAVILRTGDGGQTWECVNCVPENDLPLLDIWFADEQRGLSLGAYGTIYDTADGGETWTERLISQDNDCHLNNIVQSDSGRLYVAAEFGSLFYSDDDGLTWDCELPGYEGSFYGVLPLGSGGLLLFGLRGHLFRDSDGGRNWTTVSTGTQAMLTCARRLKDNTVIIGGLEGTLLVSRDNGRTFQRRCVPGRKGITAILPVGGDSFILLGEGGALRINLADLPSSSPGGMP